VAAGGGGRALGFSRQRAGSSHLGAENLGVEGGKVKVRGLEGRLHSLRVDTDGQQHGLLLQQRQEDGRVGRGEGWAGRQGGHYLGQQRHHRARGHVGSQRRRQQAAQQMLRGRSTLTV
jgi:hypothetical protein